MCSSEKAEENNFYTKLFLKIGKVDLFSLSSQFKVIKKLKFSILFPAHTVISTVFIGGKETKRFFLV